MHGYGRSLPIRPSLAFSLAASCAAMTPSLIGETRCVALTRDAVRGSVASSQGPQSGLIWDVILPGAREEFRGLQNAGSVDALTEIA